MGRSLLVAIAVMALAGCTAGASAPSPTGTTAVATVDPYRLQLILPKARWSTSESIAGSAALLVDGAAPVTIATMGGSPVGFAFSEIGGERRIEPGWETSCVPLVIGPDTPWRGPLAKSGGWSGEDPQASFLASFFAGPGIRLPAGRWEVAAVADFAEGGCGGPERELRATVEIEVVAP